MITRVDIAVDLTEELKKDVCGLRRGEAEPTCIKDKHTSYRQNGFLDTFTLLVGEFGILENREPKISKKRFSL